MLSLKPNLVDYDQEYRRFKWDDVIPAFSWSKTGLVNIVHEAVDRFAEGELAAKPALIYNGAQGVVQYSFKELSLWSNRFGNVLRGMGVNKGDRVLLFLPRSPEFYISLLGTIKIGAIAVPIFEGYMAEAVQNTLVDCEATVMITTAELLERLPAERDSWVSQIIVVNRSGNRGHRGQEYPDWMELTGGASEESPVVWVGREDPMLIMYTSGSTGKPKGVVHVHDGMLQYYQTGKWVLDLKEDDIYWCTADPGWVTGISYGIWAPWLNWVTNVISEGRFNASKWYHTIEKLRVTVWYSSPTAFRMLMAAGDVWRRYNLTSLRHIASVGEPLNPSVIRWGLTSLGLKIYDTWWMTETGAQLICNFPSMPVKPGSMGKPVPGISAAIVDDRGHELPRMEMGNLAIKVGWPAMMRGIWKDAEKSREYLRLEPWYLSGDLAYKDDDGYYWFQGRADDMINTSGGRVGPFEVESKLVEHPAVAEAGVIGKPDTMRGEIVKAFIVLREGYVWSEALSNEIRLFVRRSLAANAAPREIEVCERLPQTKSGKIMRRVLKSWELGLPVGDLSSLEE